MEFSAIYTSGMISYGINIYENGEFVEWTCLVDKKPKKHKAKIYFNNNGNGYFMIYGRRIHLSECLRTNI